MSFFWVTATGDCACDTGCSEIIGDCKTYYLRDGQGRVMMMMMMMAGNKCCYYLGTADWRAGPDHDSWLKTIIDSGATLEKKKMNGAVIWFLSGIQSVEIPYMLQVEATGKSSAWPVCSTWHHARTTLLIEAGYPPNDVPLVLVYYLPLYHTLLWACQHAHAEIVIPSCIWDWVSRRFLSPNGALFLKCSHPH